MKRSSFSVFYSVINALFLREIQVRFGSQKMGYLWAIIDSAAMIIVFSFIKTAIGSNHTPGIDYPVFLATSFLSYNLFRSIVMKSMDAFGANSALFAYKQVKPIDTIFSRTAVEVSVMTIVTFIFILVGVYFDFDMQVKDFIMVSFALCWFILFGMSLGIFFAVIVSFYENFKKIVGLIFLPMLFLSALFYSVESLPIVAREIILYNPIVHFIELIHGSYFAVLDTYYVDYKYMFLWTFIPLFIGLWMYQKSEEKIIST